MARIRTVKPEFFTSPDVVALSLLGRLTYIGLWTHADDYGRCVDEPRLIHAALYALDPDVTAEDVKAVIDALHAGGQVVRYEHAGRRYLQIAAWRDHQTVSHPGRDRFPQPDHPDSSITPAPGTIPDSLQNSSGDTQESLLPELGTGNREQGTIATPPKRRRREQQTLNGTPALGTAKDRRDALWEALEPHLGPAVTRTEQSNRGKTVTELLGAEAVPADVAPRCVEYRRRMPGIPLTDASLRKHWSSLVPKNGSTPREGFDDEGNWFDPDTGAWIQAQTYQQNTTR